MRALASKSFDLGNYEKALSQIARAERLAKGILPTDQHEQYLYIWLTKVEILLKKMKNEEEARESIALAKKAMDLAKSLFGEKTLITNQAMLTYAMTLTMTPESIEESRI